MILESLAGAGWGYLASQLLFLRFEHDADANIPPIRTQRENAEEHLPFGAVHPIYPPPSIQYHLIISYVIIIPGSGGIKP
jgi:hypothetical protein